MLSITQGGRGKKKREREKRHRWLFTSFRSREILGNTFQRIKFRIHADGIKGNLGRRVVVGIMHLQWCNFEEKPGRGEVRGRKPRGTGELESIFNLFVHSEFSLCRIVKLK